MKTIESSNARARGQWLFRTQSIVLQNRRLETRLRYESKDVPGDSNSLQNTLRHCQIGLETSEDTFHRGQIGDSGNETERVEFQKEKRREYFRELSRRKRAFVRRVPLRGPFRSSERRASTRCCETFGVPVGRVLTKGESRTSGSSAKSSIHKKIRRGRRSVCVGDSLRGLLRRQVPAPLRLRARRQSARALRGSLPHRASAGGASETLLSARKNRCWIFFSSSPRVVVLVLVLVLVLLVVAFENTRSRAFRRSRAQQNEKKISLLVGFLGFLSRARSERDFVSLFSGTGGTVWPGRRDRARPSRAISASPVLERKSG